MHVTVSPTGTITRDAAEKYIAEQWPLFAHNTTAEVR